FERIDPAALLQAALEPIAAEAGEKGLTLGIEVDPDLDPLAGDRALLLTALAPLVDNAVKFTDAGQILLRATRSPQGLVRLAVLDTGVGFDPAAKSALFDRFGREDLSLTRRVGGLGLGLGAAVDAAARLGGAVDAEPRPDGGSAFWLDL